MISQCLNPECRANFLHWRQGRLFAVRAQRPHVEFFWLCGTCAGNVSIDTGLDGGVRFMASQCPRTKDFVNDAVAVW